MNTKSKELITTEVNYPFWVNYFFTVISKIKYGEILIEGPNSETFRFIGTENGEFVDIKIHDWHFCEKIFLNGDIGLGESYIEGMWDSSDISQLIKFAIQNQQVLSKVIKGSFFKIIFYIIKHKLNRNTKIGSQKNIHAHYDLGNSFYELWLDRSMTYSSGLFIDNSTSLMAAQENKYKRIFDQLNIKSGDHILEVGCGWGGFMEYASSMGVKITGITISNEQFAYATQRLINSKDLAIVKLQDYRDLSGKYDHIVSIEMFEALGAEYWSTYFKKLFSLLKTGGQLIIQSITINNDDYSSYKRGTDFIQQYVFPGGMLPSPEIFKKQAEKVGFKLIEDFSFGLDYAKTLEQWETQFTAKLIDVKNIGFDDKFIRTWRFYLKYCQGGFEAKKIGVSQFKLCK